MTEPAATAVREPSRPDPLGYLADEIRALEDQSLYRPLVVMDGPQEPRTTMGGRPVISLSSNNYLGLATHPRLVEAALRAVQELGVGGRGGLGHRVFPPGAAAAPCRAVPRRRGRMPRRSGPTGGGA